MFFIDSYRDKKLYCTIFINNYSHTITSTKRYGQSHTAFAVQRGETKRVFLKYDV